ncbi:hypothetical protein CBR_g48268 [Chara braunii]|uniref:Uncharacterized protein n=1 Tax=Chara braunii TaxID=69332 RepID=A0A388M2C7_CHABU|nr:hypothetical protein CBR_g48268 [Chara braunii]|eukprot:GBG88738.1 hypothetical protein CBR_g48268 [Chara braunii]
MGHLKEVSEEQRRHESEREGTGKNGVESGAAMEVSDEVRDESRRDRGSLFGRGHSAAPQIEQHGDDRDELRRRREQERQVEEGTRPGLGSDLLTEPIVAAVPSGTEPRPGRRGEASLVDSFLGPYSSDSALGRMPPQTESRQTASGVPSTPVQPDTDIAGTGSLPTLIQGSYGGGLYATEEHALSEGDVKVKLNDVNDDESDSDVDDDDNDDIGNDNDADKMMMIMVVMIKMIITMMMIAPITLR